MTKGVGVSSSNYDEDGLVIAKSINDWNHIELSSLHNNVEDYKLSGWVDKNIKGYDTYTLSDKDYTFKNLVSEGEKGRKESMLSFNFMIPSDGWMKLNNTMYAANKNYMRSAENLSSDWILPKDVLMKKIRALNAEAEFRGVFVSNLRVFKSDFEGDTKLSNLSESGFLNDYFNVYTYKTNFIAKVKTSRALNMNDGLILSVTTGNDSLNFSTKLSKTESRYRISEIFQIQI